jgi:hypothetical protein
MALGRLAHYVFDAVLVSTVLAGVRRSSGFSYVTLPFVQWITPTLHYLHPDLTSLRYPTRRSAVLQKNS